MSKGPKYKLVRGAEKAYTENSMVKNEYFNAVYFATDTQRIFLNGECYGQGKAEKVVTGISVNKEGIDYILKVNYSDGDNFTFNLGTLLLYASKIPDNEVVPVKVGNIAAGTKASELKIKSVSEVLDEIIFPEMQPEVVEPRATISFENPGLFRSGDILEVGAQAPKDFITDFSTGSAKVVGQEKQSRSGELISDQLTGVMCNGDSKLPDEVILGEMEYVYQAHYDRGPEILTSKGNVSAVVNPNPLPEGTIKSGSLKIYGTYPYICNGQSASIEYQEMTLPTKPGSLSKLPLVAWEQKVIGAMFASEAISDQRISFRFPEKKQLMKVEYFNTVGGNWCILNPDNYEVTPDPDQKIVQGLRVNYKMFTTKGNLMGAIQLRFTLENA